jgi:hypothetical protein
MSIPVDGCIDILNIPRLSPSPQAGVGIGSNRECFTDFGAGAALIDRVAEPGALGDGECPADHRSGRAIWMHAANFEPVGNIDLD